MRALQPPIRSAAGLVTPTGRGLVLLGGLSLALGHLGGVTELRIFGWVALALLLLAIPWLLVPSGVRARIQLHPPRAVAGEGVQARITVGHEWGLPLWQPLVRVMAGREQHWMRLPTLRTGATLTHAFEIETARRGILPVGPVEHHLTDPLGLLRRPATWVRPVELYVRPEMVAIETLGGGQVHDLEGVPSDSISMSDLAFHALREYVRGDDLRHVHWRSSARAGQLLVRQYQDTRRNHATVVLDLARESYGPSDEDGLNPAFELAASIAASLVSCAALESEHVSLVAGDERHPGATASSTLDALCRVEVTRRSDAAAGLASDVAVAVSLVPDTSLMLAVTGGAADPETVAAGLWVTPPDVEAVVLRADPGAEANISLAQGRKVLTVGDLAQLPGLMRTLG